jgi:hypothetical protein
VLRLRRRMPAIPSATGTGVNSAATTCSARWPIKQLPSRLFILGKFSDDSERGLIRVLAGLRWEAPKWEEPKLTEGAFDGWPPIRRARIFSAAWVYSVRCESW